MPRRRFVSQNFVLSINAFLLDMTIAENIQEYATSENFLAAYKAQQGRN